MGAAGSAQPREQHRTCNRPAAVRDDRDLGITRHLTLAAVAAQLHDGLVQVPVAVQPPGRELPALRVQRYLAVERDALASFDERAALAVAAEAERFQPRHREPAEAVV